MTGAIEDDPKEGPTVLQFGVPMNAKGVSIEETWDSLGMRGTGSHDVVFDGVFVPDAAIAARRKPDVWHPLLHLVSMIAFPIVYSVYTGIAEKARDIAVAQAAKRRDPAYRALGELETELAAVAHGLRRLVAFCETATPGPETTNTVFIHRSLVARERVAHGRSRDGRHRRRRATSAASVWSGCSATSRARASIRCRRVQRRLAGRMALGLPIDG